MTSSTPGARPHSRRSHWRAGCSETGTAGSGAGRAEKDQRHAGTSPLGRAYRHPAPGMAQRLPRPRRPIPDRVGRPGRAGQLGHQLQLRPPPPGPGHGLPHRPVRPQPNRPRHRRTAAAPAPTGHPRVGALRARPRTQPRAHLGTGGHPARGDPAGRDRLSGWAGGVRAGRARLREPRRGRQAVLAGHQPGRGHGHVLGRPRRDPPAHRRRPGQDRALPPVQLGPGRARRHRWPTRRAVPAATARTRRHRGRGRPHRQPHRAGRARAGTGSWPRKSSPAAASPSASTRPR